MILVLDERVGHLVLLRVGVLDVADRAIGAADQRGDTFIALAAQTRRPFERRIDPDLRLPIATDLGEIVGEIIGRAGAVRAMHDGDRLVGQAGPLVEIGDLLVVPFDDLAEEDVGDDRARQLELAGFDALDVEDRDDAAHDHRELGQSALLELLGGQRDVGGAEIDRLALDLLYAAARADRLVVHRQAALRLVGLGPFRIDRVREGSAGAGNLGCLGWRQQHGGDRACQARARQGFRHRRHRNPPRIWELRCLRGG